MAAQLTSEMGHLSDAEAAEYLDRRLPLAQRDRVEGHLASCPDCRAQLLHARQILADTRQSRRPMVIGGAIAVAAAMVLFLIRPAAHQPERFAPAPVMRGQMETGRLIAYGPTGETHARKLRFVWSAALGVTTYRLTVTRGDGASVWSQGSTDTSVALSDSVVLRSNQRYFWVADALLGDGGTRSTGLREFSLVP